MLALTCLVELTTCVVARDRNANALTLFGKIDHEEYGGHGSNDVASGNRCVNVSVDMHVGSIRHPSKQHQPKHMVTRT